MSDAVPWWAKLSASSALILIALGSFWTLSQKVDANETLMIQSLGGIERVLGKHSEDSERWSLRNYELNRANCLNQAIGGNQAQKLQNCLEPTEAVWPGDSNPTTRRTPGRMFDR
jgi:hypothetical protein